MSKSMVLVVDDEPQIARVLRRSLEDSGYEVRVAPDGESGFDVFRTLRPQLVVTDIAMPNIGGVELCKRVRSMSSVPIIVLSVKGDEKTKVEALDAGADDYVTKPFGMDELHARIRALLRRSDAGEKKPTKEVITLGDFVVNLPLREVTVRGKEVKLTPKEYDLLLYFVNHPDRVLTHRSILTAVWGANSSTQSEYLRVFVGQLRKKVERNPNEPKYLKTEPWVGYRFQPEP